MKALYFLALAMIVSSLALAQSDSLKTSEQPYYVVTGVFSVQKNAMLYSRQMPKYKLQGKYEMNFNKGLHYVYVLKINDRAAAIEEAMRLRTRPDSMFTDAWVYHGSFKKQEPGETVVNKVINPIEDQTKITETKPIPVQPEKNHTKPFIFKIVRIDSGTEVSGEVIVVDVDLAKKIGAYEGNKKVTVEQPKGKSGKITMTTHIPGYRRVQHTLNYLDPAGDSVEMKDSTMVVMFELTRLQKGDLTVSEIYFFRDAAIMKPESKFEVTSIADMMTENPKYKIRIHGHTNGDARGRIIYKKELADDWFSLTETKEGSGSAKKLSEERAEVVKKYLMSKGIDAKRMEVKAWGGKKPIYDAFGSQAQSNVRVEIEILEN